MKQLDQVRFHRIVSVPRVHDAPQRQDRLSTTHLSAAWTSAHAILTGVPREQAVSVFAWVRRGGRETHLLIGGSPPFPPAAGAGPTRSGPQPVLYPPGARALTVESTDVVATLTAFPAWVACGGRAEAVASATRSDTTGSESTGTAFEDHLAHLPHDVAWVVIAEPVDAADLEREIVDIEIRVPRMRLKTNSESDRVELERAESRYRDLIRARIAGLWSVRILVGAATAPEALANAAVLCSSCELDDLPYALMPSTETSDLAAALDRDTPLRGDASVPFAASSDLLAVLGRTPAREIPGVRVVQPHGFDLTVEGTGRDGWTLGRVLDRAWMPSGNWTISRSSLNRHAFVCGATGSGKSQTMRTLLQALAEDPDPVPWLVIEPAKAEYARMAGRLGSGRVTVLRPGDPDAVPGCLNPLQPEPGFSLQGHADLIRALFAAAFEVQEPFPQVLAQALERVYTDAGWDLLTGEPRPRTAPVLDTTELPRPVIPRYPDLADLQRTARAVVDDVGYGPEVAANIRGFVDVRIGSLRAGASGGFFEGGHPLNLPALLDRHAVLELEGITNDQDKAFLIGVVLIRLVEHLRRRGPADTDLRHLLVIEEAHRLLRAVEHGPAAGAVELFAGLLAEIRAYGQGVAVVEQIPSKLLPDVLKNTAVKIMHRLPSDTDRAAVGATMNLSDHDSAVVLSLAPGVAAAATDGMDHPVLVEMPLTESRETTAGASHTPPLVGTRSRLCPSECQEAPCTARTINAATHASRDPLLVLWAEATVTSFLVGFPAPRPTTRTQEALSTLTSPTCARIHLAERAVGARRAQLRPWLDPEALTERLLAALNGDPDDPDDWLRWTAGYHRWQTVHHTLRALPPDAPPPAETVIWRRWGLHLDASTAGEQFIQLTGHASYRDGQERLVVGDTATSLLRSSVMALGGTLSPDGFRSALSAVVDQPWPDQLTATVAHLLKEDR